MNREIKFRAWTGGKMHFEEFDSYLGGFGCYFQSFENEPDALMQFTGLKDKNGVEIYEDDIITFEGKNLIVSYGDDAGFVFGNFPDDLPLQSEMDCEVIGNVYENLELLERETNFQVSNAAELPG